MLDPLSAAERRRTVSEFAQHDGGRPVHTLSALP